MKSGKGAYINKPATRRPHWRCKELWAFRDQFMLQVNIKAFCLQDGESFDLAHQMCHPLLWPEESPLLRLIHFLAFNTESHLFGLEMPSQTYKPLLFWTCQGFLPEEVWSEVFINSSDNEKHFWFWMQRAPQSLYNKVFYEKIYWEECLACTIVHRAKTLPYPGKSETHESTK